MLKIMIYAYMNHKYSTREIENACQRDINFMRLLEGAKAPWGLLLIKKVVEKLLAW